jgi:hypothetical protein
VISGTPEDMRGRKRVNFEQVLARLPLGSLQRIKAALGENESQADFLKTAVETELTRRERETKRKG